MSLLVDRYVTSKFILKDNESVAYIKKLVNLLQNEENLSIGYISKDDYSAVLYEYGDKTFKFVAGGYIDSGPELKYSAIYKSNIDQKNIFNPNIDNDSICLFLEIQKNLQEGTWFFVENHCVEKKYLNSYIALYHQDGRIKFKNSHDSKVEMLQSFNIKE
jgi:hypothetical protein